VAVIFYATSYADRPYMAGDTCPPPSRLRPRARARRSPSRLDRLGDRHVRKPERDRREHQVHAVSGVRPRVVVDYGDVCNLGIYCDGSSTGNRSLFENNAVYTDQSAYLVAGWGDQRLDPSTQTRPARTPRANRRRTTRSSPPARRRESRCLRIRPAHRRAPSRPRRGRCRWHPDPLRGRLGQGAVAAVARVPYRSEYGSRRVSAARAKSAVNARMQRLQHS
jgi:hypothetical protein